jgi:Tat protein translocase TatB subunit
MFNLGFSEMVIVGILALILIGPKQLPEMARTVGRFINELKRSTDSLKDEFNAELHRIEDDKTKEQLKIFEADPGSVADTESITATKAEGDKT